MVALHAADEVIEVHDPATGAILGQVAVSTPDDVRAAVARAAQAAWSARPVATRARRVARFRDELLARAEEVIGAIVAETGKPRPYGDRTLSWTMKGMRLNLGPLGHRFGG